jgi:hypothetical protein
MSPELGFALFFTLLWGPTALWLGYRALREHRSRLSESFNIASEPVRSSQPVSGEPEALVSQGFWVCGACRSLSRREANRCYSCQTAMGSTDQPPPAEQPVRPMVPVMAEIAPPATPWIDQPVLDVPVRDPEPVLTAAPREAPAGVPVCPFLGFRDDPSTRCDFPDHRNLCHAGSGRGATSFASPRRLIPGKVGTVRSQEIGAAHQMSRCLTAAHEQCARYPAVEVVAASR